MSSGENKLSRMAYGEVAGVGKPVSKIVMGTLGAKEVDQASPLFDEFVSQGGKCFDTARHYGVAESWCLASGCGVRAFVTRWW